MKTYYCDQCEKEVKYMYMLHCVHSDNKTYRHFAKSKDFKGLKLTIVVKGGCVQDVLNVPEGLEIEIKDLD